MTNLYSFLFILLLTNSKNKIICADVSTTELFALPRVVVTGMGITSCLGNTLEDVTKSLKEAESGITFNPEFAELGIKSQVCGKPDLTEEDFAKLIPKSSLRFMGDNAKYAYVALLVIAAIITPSPDWGSQLIVVIPLVLLYELSIIIAARVAKNQEKAWKEWS